MCYLKNSHRFSFHTELTKFVLQSKLFPSTFITIFHTLQAAYMYILLKVHIVMLYNTSVTSFTEIHVTLYIAKICQGPDTGQ